MVGKEAVMMMQEVPAWSHLDGWGYGGYIYRTGEESEAGIFISRESDKNVKKADGGRDWYGITIDEVMYLSIHAVDIWRQTMEGNRYEIMRAEVDEFIVQARVGKVKHIVMGIDANTTLRQEEEGRTGSNLMDPKGGAQ